MSLSLNDVTDDERLPTPLPSNHALTAPILLERENDDISYKGISTVFSNIKQCTLHNLYSNLPSSAKNILSLLHINARSL